MASSVKVTATVERSVCRTVAPPEMAWLADGQLLCWLCAKERDGAVPVSRRAYRQIQEASDA